jgi:hypothetical protein
LPACSTSMPGTKRRSMSPPPDTDAQFHLSTPRIMKKRTPADHCITVKLPAVMLPVPV